MFASLKNIQTQLIKNPVNRISIKLRTYLELTW